jgi:hypothetical protein
VKEALKDSIQNAEVKRRAESNDMQRNEGPKMPCVKASKVEEHRLGELVVFVARMPFLEPSGRMRHRRCKARADLGKGGGQHVTIVM